MRRSVLTTYHCERLVDRAIWRSSRRRIEAIEMLRRRYQGEFVLACREFGIHIESYRD
jgi:hypothetical protein